MTVSTLTLRQTKGARLTTVEMDNNWLYCSDSSNATFAQSGIGAVSTDSRTKMRERKSFEDFGAVGDGVTDDAAAWATALSAMGSANFELHGTPGKTYLIGAAGVSIANKTNARIVSDGAKIKVNAVATQAPAGFGSTVIFLDTCTNAIFSGWEIDGNSKASNVIGLSANTDCEISHNKITSAGISGLILALGNTRCRYHFNICNSGINASRGMWLGNYAASQMETDISIIGNHCISNGGTGIVCASVGGRVALNKCNSNGGAGLIFGGANGFASKYLAIAGNVCRSNTFHGIQSDVAYSTAADLPIGIAITGNVCELNLGSGIYGVNLTDSAISGNTCINNNSDGVGTGCGIQVEEANGIAITGNTCSDTRTGASRTQTDGINVSATVGTVQVSNITLSGNICRNNLSIGIHASTASTFTINALSIAGNIVAGNGAQGIIVTEATAGKVTRLAVAGNVADANTSSDIRVSVDDVALSGNSYSTETAVEYRSFTDLDATPSVKGRRVWRAANTGATTVTAFDDGVNGQEIVVYASNGNTTVQQGGTIVNKGAVNVTVPSNGMISYQRFDTTWIEQWRSF